MEIRVSSMSADIYSGKEYGFHNLEETIQIFYNHSWKDELIFRDKLEESINPQITLTSLDGHCILQCTEYDEFEIEICVLDFKKILGIFKKYRFFEYYSIPSVKVEEFIRAIFLENLTEQHMVLSNLLKTNIDKIKRINR